MKWIITVILIAVIAMQFIPRTYDQDSRIKATDITRIYPVPPKVQAVLKNSCYDCHSDYTRYPWYARIQPVNSWMTSHINQGKKELNFSEFGSYSGRRQQSKLKAIINSIQDKKMPLTAYTLIHKNAKLTETDKKSVISWIEKTKDSLSLIN
ncbi:heme-binding domain-containing protein [Pedobacter lusitanus]|nr:heme-binding domain-containing protein [Pedobacter lusitanus]